MRAPDRPRGRAAALLLILGLGGCRSDMIPATAGICRLELSATPMPLLGIHARVHLPSGIWLTDEAVDFYGARALQRLAAAPCRTYATFGWFNVIPGEGPEALPDGVVIDALRVPPEHVKWTEQQFTGDRFIGTVEIRGWYQENVTPRKGLVTLQVVDGVAYYYYLEAPLLYWNSLVDTLRRSAETVVFRPSQG